jgi:hypothetical protein
MRDASTCRDDLRQNGSHRTQSLVSVRPEGDGYMEAAEHALTCTRCTCSDRSVVREG